MVNTHPRAKGIDASCCVKNQDYPKTLVSSNWWIFLYTSNEMMTSLGNIVVSSQPVNSLSSCITPWLLSGLHPCYHCAIPDRESLLLPISDPHGGWRMREWIFLQRSNRWSVLFCVFCELVFYSLCCAMCMFLYSLWDGCHQYAEEKTRLPVWIQQVWQLCIDGET